MPISPPGTLLTNGLGGPLWGELTGGLGIGPKDTSPHDFISPLWDTLFTVIASACPEATTLNRQPTFKQSQMERVNWQEHLEGGTLIPPWVFVGQWQVTPATEYAFYDFYWATIPVFYIAQVGAEGGSGDVDFDVYQALLRLKQGFQGSGFGFTFGETGLPNIDTGPDNGVNRVFLDNDLPLLGGSLTLTCLIGDPDPYGFND